METFNKAIEDSVAAAGYATVEVNQTYYYTIGFGKQGKPDLFALAVFPFSFFQCVAQDYANGKLKVDETNVIEEFKIPGFGLEPSVVRLQHLSLGSSTIVAEQLSTGSSWYPSFGSLFVLGPDSDNILMNTEGSGLQADPDIVIQTLAKSLNNGETQDA